MISSLSSKNAHRYSVVIVTHNNGDEILTCLASLQNNAAKYCSLQIIIVDNASTDQTRSKVNLFQTEGSANIECLTIFNPTNYGFTVALNQGIRLAEAPFVLILNPDTILPAGLLDTLISTIKSSRQIGVVAPQLRNADQTVQPSCRRFPRHRDVLFTVTGLAQVFKSSKYFNGWKMGDFDHRHSRFVEQPQGACLFTTREILQKVGAWDESFPMFFSDVDWCFRVVRTGYKILFTPDVSIVHHRGSSVFPKRAQMILSSHRSFARYFLKYYRGWQWLLPNGFVLLLLALSGLVRYILSSILKSKTQSK